jgi:DNA gyrase/topoisomerase IV subunit B
MRISFTTIKAMQLGLLAAAFTVSSSAQSFLAELKQEHDPGKRVEMALSFADELFDSAKTHYQKGNIHEGDVALENMTTALNACVDSVATANKAKFYKKAEMKVAALQRRLSGVMEDLSVTERGWADQTARRVEEIHSKLLDGVMRK